MDHKQMKTAFLYSMALTVFVYAVFHLERILRVFENLFYILTPFLSGVLIYCFISVPADRISCLLQHRISSINEKTALKVGAVASYFLLASGFVFVIIVLLPSIAESASVFAKLIEELSESGIEWLEKSARNFSEEFDARTVLHSVSEMVSELLTTESTARLAGEFASGLIRTVATIFIGTVFSAYILIGRSRIRQLTSDFLSAFVPEPGRSALVNLIRRFLSTFRKFIYGQITDASFLGACCFIYALLLKLPNAAAVAVTTMVSSLVPIAGPYIGAIACSILIAEKGAASVLGFLIYIVVVQQIDNHLIYPRIVGHALGVDEMFIFMGALIGASFAGIKGLIFGVPVTAFVFSILKEFTERKLSRLDNRINKENDTTL